MLLGPIFLKTHYLRNNVVYTDKIFILNRSKSLEPSGIMPLPEPMLTKVDDAICWQ